MSKSDKFTAFVAAVTVAVTFLFGGTRLGVVSAAVAVGLFIMWRRHREGKAHTWRELSGLFEKLAAREIAASHRLHDACAVVNADLDEPPHKTWSIASADRDCQRDAELLCGQAGALLLSSDSVRVTLSEQAKLARNDADRWLYFLKDVGEATSGDERVVVESIKNGKTEQTLYLISINSVTKASIRGCTECLRREHD